ncbi:MAG TPA: methylated-DNA--[protein]-cysteine S-methyltransferase [Pseudomonadales bacterium]|nr:methylated-DNA--[protein]-cysteine S-methyltransferase [Pseudomonadales bacterium]
MKYCFIDTPVGEVLLAGDKTGLHYISFPQGKGHVDPEPDWERDDAALGNARKQMEEYFAGKRREFDLKLVPSGTGFQLAVLRALQKIPYGETRSYRDIAVQIGKPRAVRAVGAANGRNPLPIVIPCHRVVGSDGSLTGFGGGLDAKRFLLDLEQTRQGRLI